MVPSDYWDFFRYAIINSKNVEKLLIQSIDRVKYVILFQKFSFTRIINVNLFKNGYCTNCYRYAVGFHYCSF